MKSNTLQVKLTIHDMVGILDIKGDSVRIVRNIRKKLSKEKFDLEDINKLAD